MKDGKTLMQLWLESYLVKMIDKKAKKSFRTRTQYVKDLILKDISVDEAKNES